MSVHQLDWWKALTLLLTATLLGCAFAVAFQIWILFGKGFELSETLPNALVSAEISWFVLPAVATACGAVVGALGRRQLAVSLLIAGFSCAFTLLNEGFYIVAVLFSCPAVLIALAPMISRRFILEKQNV